MIKNMKIQGPAMKRCQKLISPVSSAEAGCHQDADDPLVGGRHLTEFIKNVRLWISLLQRQDIPLSCDFLKKLRRHFFFTGSFIPLANHIDPAPDRVRSHEHGDLVCAVRNHRFALRRNLHRHTVAAVPLHQNNLIFLADFCK